MLGKWIELAVGTLALEHDHVAGAALHFEPSLCERSFAALIIVVQIDERRHHPAVADIEPVEMRSIFLARLIAQDLQRLALRHIRLQSPWPKGWCRLSAPSENRTPTIARKARGRGRDPARRRHLANTCRRA